MGAQHGAILAELGGFEPVTRFYPQMPARMLGLAFDHRVRRFVEPVLREVLNVGARRLTQARRAHFPAYAARTEAMVEVGRMPREVGSSFVVMDALQNAIGVLGRMGLLESTGLSVAAVAACSSLAVWGRSSGDGRLRHARNFDFPGAGVWDRAPTVVFCEPDEGLRYGFVTTRGVDVACVTVFNEAGLTLSAHTRFHRDVAFDGVAISDLGHEIVRRSRTLDEAVRVARTMRSASSWGLLVSSAEERRAVLIETTERGVAVTEPGPSEHHLGTTNRYRAPSLQPGEVTSSLAFVVDSNARFARLEAAVREAQAGLSREDLERLLGDTHDPGAAPGEEAATRLAGNCIVSPITVQSVVCEPEERQLRVSVGPAPTGLGPYVTVPYDWDGPVGLVALPKSDPDGGRVLPVSERHAMRLYAAAASAQVEGAEPTAVRALVDSAVDHAPDEPNLRFLAALLALQAGEVDCAATHLERARDVEAGPYRRGVLLLWTARVESARGRRFAAEAARRELERLDDPDLTTLREASRRERRRSPSRRALTSLVPDLMLIDATLPAA